MSEIVSFPGLNLEIPVKKIAFSIGSLEITWYGILIATGLLLAMLFAFRYAKSFGIDSDRFLDVVLVGAIFGIIGARLYYVIFSDPGSYRTFWDIIDLRSGGLGFYGALIGGVVSGVLACRWRKLKVLPVLDLTGLGFLIGQGIGRWGNFINQEAFGTNTTLPWGMTSPSVVRYLQASSSMLAEKGMTVNPNLPVHPTFLYESLWCLLGFLVLFLYMKHRKFDGELFLMYLAWNGFGRAFFEGLRTDSLYSGSLRISQVLALIWALASLAIILVVRARIRKAENPDYLKPYGMTEAATVELAAIEAERVEKARKKKTKVGDAGAAEKAADKADTEVKATDKKAKEAAAAAEAKAAAVAEKAEKSAEKAEKSVKAAGKKAEEKVEKAAKEAKQDAKAAVTKTEEKIEKAAKQTEKTVKEAAKKVKEDVKKAEGKGAEAVKEAASKTKKAAAKAEKKATEAVDQAEDDIEKKLGE